MAFTKDQAEERLRDTKPLTREDLNNLIPVLATIGDALTLRIGPDFFLQTIDAVKKFDASSAELSNRMLFLTWVIAVLTVIMTGATILTAMPLIQSWLAGNH